MVLFALFPFVFVYYLRPPHRLFLSFFFLSICASSSSIFIFLVLLPAFCFSYVTISYRFAPYLVSFCYVMWAMFFVCLGCIIFVLFCVICCYCFCLIGRFLACYSFLV